MLQRDYTRPNVWAPNASRVDVCVDGTRHSMEARGDGWWLSPEAFQPGQRYAFSVDGGELRPDPRSVLQPDGVHGPSEIVDPALFEGRPAWPGKDLLGEVQYELHVGTFTAQGTFDAAIERLPELVELGVGALELMPVMAFAGDRGWGYDGVALYSVHAAYGGPAGLIRFVDAAHELGLGVIMDVVHNHLGPEGNYLGDFGPYFTLRHETPWGPAVNLDDDASPEVRSYLLGSVRQWVMDFGVDGLRLDAVHELRDESDEHFLSDLAQAAERWQESLGRPVTLIAEADLNQPFMVTPVGEAEKARGMDGQWADDVHHAIHSFVTREDEGYYGDFADVAAVKKTLEQVFLHDGGYSTFREQNWGAPVDRDSEFYDGHSFVVFMQNHDQVGNRPAGDRVGHTVPAGAQAAGAALYLLSAFTPMIFMGEEWAASTPFPFFSHLGPELGALVSEGRAREFSRMGGDGVVPDPQAESTFTSAKLRWSERAEPEHARMLKWYQALIALRRSEPDVSDASLRSTSVEIVDDDTVMMRRGGIAVVATRAVQGAAAPVSGEVLLAWDEVESDDVGVRLPGPGAVVIRTS